MQPLVSFSPRCASQTSMRSKGGDEEDGFEDGGGGNADGDGGCGHDANGHDEMRISTNFAST